MPTDDRATVNTTHVHRLLPVPLFIAGLHLAPMTVRQAFMMGNRLRAIVPALQTKLLDEYFHFLSGAVTARADDAAAPALASDWTLVE